ncbi:hypothetical protein CDL12_27478 [Handroanthus impetiginosus]|uniref:Uncharacterized protein n=1 Tax=Handroanthus impetiginosus TaxID=429701 RepID=A0A2G9G3Z8_9LAMI|nr:hypothetical protein CDL12_27478 [Handroanthus impetiginosus]
MARKLKRNVTEAINDLIQEITTCHEQIAGQAVEHMHQKYVPYDFWKGIKSLYNWLFLLFLI